MYHKKCIKMKMLVCFIVPIVFSGCSLLIFISGDSILRPVETHPSFLPLGDRTESSIKFHSLQNVSRKDDSITVHLSCEVLLEKNTDKVLLDAAKIFAANNPKRKPDQVILLIDEKKA